MGLRYYYRKVAQALIKGGEIRAHNNSIKLRDELKKIVGELKRLSLGVERAANLFIYGTVYSACIALVIAAAGSQYPFLPRHLTLVRALSVGIPGLVLALAPDSRRARTGFVHRVVRFAVPAGVIAAIASLVVYFLTLTGPGADSIVEARSATTIALLGVGLGILLHLTRSLPPWRWVLVSAMAASVLVVLAVPALSEFFKLDTPDRATWIVILVTVMVASLAVRFIPVTADSPHPVPGAGAGPGPI
jgi:magnesium-transporting ATPase (P-type)